MFVSAFLPPPTPIGILPPMTSLAPAVRSGQSPGLWKQKAPSFLGTLRGGVGQKGGLPGASQVKQSAREVLSHGHCNHFSSTQPLTWEKPQHSEMESWIAHFKTFTSDLAHLTASLSVAYSFSNFDYYLSLFPNNLWKNRLWIGCLSVLFFRFNLTEQCPGFEKQVEEFSSPFFIFFLIKHISNAFPFGDCQDLSELSGFFFFPGFMEKMSLLSLCLCW